MHRDPSSEGADGCVGVRDRDLVLDCSKLTPCLEKLQKQGVLDTQGVPLPSSGECAYQLSWNSQTAKIEAEIISAQWTFEDSKISHVAIRLSKDPQRLRIEEARWNDCRAYGEIDLSQKTELPFTYRFSKAGISSSGEGTIDLAKKSLSLLPRIECVLMKQNLLFVPAHPITIQVALGDEIHIDEGRWEEASSHSLVEAKKFRWLTKEKLWEIEKIDFKISAMMAKKIWPALQTNSLEGTARCIGSSTGYEVQGNLCDGDYGFEGCLFKGKAIQWRILPDRILLGAKTICGETELIATLQVDLSEHLAMLKLQKPGQDGVLSTFFRTQEQGPLLLEKCSGECLGIRADLKSIGPNRLKGRIECDFTELEASLPASIRASLSPLKLGKGYAFEGEISLENPKDWKAEGLLTGRECVLFGSLWHQLEGKVSLSPKRHLLRQFEVRDSAGTMAIPQLRMEQAKEGMWVVGCPLISIKDLHPSKLRKIGENEQELKPFVLRNLTLTDFYGELDHPEGFQGTCALQFTNAWKKEATILDIPLNIFKDLGLEPSLLVPIQGELLGHLENSKLRFTQLKGSYSEGRRTQFALSPQGEGSYIDFDGKLHIDLIMKQAVVLKLAESLVLGIRGNLEKPRYLLLP